MRHAADLAHATAGPKSRTTRLADVAGLFNATPQSFGSGEVLLRFCLDASWIAPTALSDVALQRHKAGGEHDDRDEGGEEEELVVVELHHAKSKLKKLEEDASCTRDDDETVTTTTTTSFTNDDRLYYKNGSVAK